MEMNYDENVRRALVMTDPGDADNIYRRYMR